MFFAKLAVEKSAFGKSIQHNNSNKAKRIAYLYKKR
jgi:hypothetical protein